MSNFSDYREYYEELSQRRDDLRTRRDRELNDNIVAPPLSIIHRVKFKDKLYAQIAKKSSGLKASLKLLDIGCGYGMELPSIRMAFGNTIYGIDISFNQIKMARESLNNDQSYKFTQSYAETLPFKDNSFDAVVFSEVIEHLPKPQVVIREILRLLKKGGCLFISTPNKYAYFHLIGTLIPSPLRNWLSNKLRGTQWDVNPADFVPCPDMKEHISLFSPFSLQRMLKKEGFAIEVTLGGMLETPAPYLFDQNPWLMRCWEALDRMVDLLPFSFYLKANFIILARK